MLSLISSRVCCFVAHLLSSLKYMICAMRSLANIQTVRFGMRSFQGGRLQFAERSVLGLFL